MLDRMRYIAFIQVRMAERSKALRSGRSPLLWAWVRIPLLTKIFSLSNCCTMVSAQLRFWCNLLPGIAEWRSGSVLGP